MKFPDLELINPETELGRITLEDCRKDMFKLLCFEKGVVGEKQWWPVQYTRKFYVKPTYIPLCNYDIGRSGGEALSFKTPLEAIFKGIVPAVRAKLTDTTDWTMWRPSLPSIQPERRIDLYEGLKRLWLSFPLNPSVEELGLILEAQ